MMRTLKRLNGDQQGLTLTEMAVTVMVMGIALAALSSLLLGFFGNVGTQLALSNAERDVRPVIREMVVEIRQAEPPSQAATAVPVLEMEWDRLTFHSDRLPLDGVPEKHTYELVNCTNGANGGTCDLQRTVIQADVSSVPPLFTYVDNTLDRQEIVLTSVLADPYLTIGPLFHGVVWVGSPAARTSVTSCNAATPCTFPLVIIDLRVDPSVRENPGDYEIHEEVRLRNAPDS
ncbi:MAG: prepilin-type N-terminal cleavage/methylation domain-containing protein [Acidimicrobiia bacterium]|nr:prepilin-type N-terminal cleavage/methylation domain-containing protein [Acidimicrobiia bacterium]